MKGKLIKTGNDYLIKDTNGEVLAITNGVTDGKKLSKQNCDEIFGVVDIEKLAYDFAKYHSIYPTAQDDTEYGFKNGFNKAIELNKDKVFTEEDVRKAYMDGVSNGHNFGYPAIDHTDKYIQSLQQPTEIDVEIKMEPCFYDQSLGGFSTSYTEDKPKEQPKLDKDGCLILKKI
jgi:hypothetical protein